MRPAIHAALAAALLSPAPPACTAPVTARSAPPSSPSPAETARDASPEAASDATSSAISILSEAAVGNDPALRANAIEALALVPDRARPAVTRALSDPNPAVRFAAVVTAGKLDLRDLAPAIEPLADDQSPHVRAAAIYALHRFGHDADLNQLARMLAGPDPRLRANVALLLGLLGDASAVPMLRNAATQPMHRAVSPDHAAVVRIQIAEAIARLDENASIDALRAGAFHNSGEVRVLAINAMGAVQDRQMVPALHRLMQEPPIEVQLAAAAALARIENAAGLSITIDATRHENPVVRAQAAWGLGWFANQPTARQALTRLLRDPRPQVRVTAAASLLRLDQPAG